MEYFHEVTTFVNGKAKIVRVPVAQELCRQGLDALPERFIKINPDEIQIRSANNESLKPLRRVNAVKLRSGSDPGDRAMELEKLAEGLREWGMVLVDEQSFDYRVLQELKEVVQGFFGLSFEEKKRSVGSFASVDNVGYGRNYIRSEDQPLDWIDRLIMKPVPKGGDEGLDVWPRKPANFRQAMEKYCQEARRLMNDMLEAIAETLSLDRNAFLKYYDAETSEINARVNYYPPCPGEIPAQGIPGHSDPSGLSFLTQFGATDGLQVSKSGVWVTLPWPENAVLVSIGDLLEIMSGGRVQSPFHRVVVHNRAERISVALFYNPPPRTVIEPVKEPAEGAEGEERSCREVVVEEYLKYYYRVSPANAKLTNLYARRKD